MRLDDRANSDRFEELKAVVVEPTSAMVNLLDPFVRLPQDVHVLEIARDGQAEVSHGHIVLKRNDEVTLVGEPKERAMLAPRWGC